MDLGRCRFLLAHFRPRPTVALLLVSFAASGSLPAQETSAEAHAARGMEHARSGQLAQAEGELRQAVSLAPAAADYAADLGTVLAREGKLEESSVYYQKSLRTQPGNIEIRRNLAANEWQLHHYADAKRNLLLVLKANPGDSQAALLLGMVCENAGDYPAAVEWLSSVPDLVRRQPQAMAALAKSYYRTGQRSQGSAWVKDLRGNPGDAQAVFLGAGIADDERDYPTAELMLQSLASSFPDTNLLQYRIAVVKSHAGQWESSRAILQRLTEQGYKKVEVYELLGRCERQLGHFPEAIKQYQEALRLNPTREENYLAVGETLFAERRPGAVLELAKRMTDAFPSSPRAFSLRGSAELQMEQFKDAASSFSMALTLAPEDPNAALGLARAQAGSGMAEDAKKTLETAIRYQAKKAPFELELALLLLKQVKSADSSERLRAESLLNACLKDPNTAAEAHYQLGSLALQSGQSARALAELQAAEKLRPANAATHFALARVYRRLGRISDADTQMSFYNKWKESSVAPSPEAPPAPVPNE